MNKVLLLIFLYSLSYSLTQAEQIGHKQPSVDKLFSCPPCAHHSGYLDDLYHETGSCPVCNMELIAKPNFNALDQPKLKPGSGNFVMTAGASKPDKSIVVFYHQPEKLNKDTRVLFVVPGSGRNAWSYRDMWKKVAEQHNILLLSPSYSEQQYDFAAYHMGGVVKNLRFADPRAAQEGRATSRFHLRDEDILFDLNIAKDSWIFNDFDRIFDAVVLASGLQQSSYDMFGHSAGAQLLHRMVLFQPESKAAKIIAANSGLYTLPNTELGPLFGLKGTGVDQDSLTKSFGKRLLLLIGEQDNQDEQGGTMLHTPLADQQGMGRLSRGKYFYTEGQLAAKAAGAAFNWQIKIIKGVGHDSRKMSKAASKLLYGD